MKRETERLLSEAIEGRGVKIRIEREERALFIELEPPSRTLLPDVFALQNCASAAAVVQRRAFRRDRGANEPWHDPQCAGITTGREVRQKQS